MRRHERAFSDNIVRDYFNNETNHDIYTPKQERKIMKRLKLSFYDEVSVDIKKIYLEYYMEVNHYFKDKYLEATDDDKEILLRQAINEAKRMRDDFIAHNFRLVVNVVNSYYHKNLSQKVERIDLIQEGNIGLLKAVKQFDIEMDVRFATYAVYLIKQSINNWLAMTARVVRLPQRVRDEIRELIGIRKSFIENFSREPFNHELVQMTGKSEFKIVQLLEIYRNFYLDSSISLNGKVGDEEDTEIGDFIADDVSIAQQVENMIFEEELLSLINTSNLSWREKEIIIKRFGFNGMKMASIEELAIFYQIPESRIMELESRGLAKLKQILLERGFEKKDNYQYGIRK